ncbi:MAG: ABC transporter ATP-binding protein [Candidatus Nomurabacteria bacterium]|jgi:ABC-2 type transport system ATP-binding protein|nr:ABC transporter ATP-binding protein [Candidatus Nomurabacteria bacterium]
MKDNIAIKVSSVSKSFRLPTEQSSGIKQAIINAFKGIKGYREQKVLRDISFEVERGDFFGIVGRNGSGKSTLLKLISQIYEPEEGKIEVNGSLVPFIELGVGFNPELTGRENVYMNGALLGFAKDEISAMYDEIVEFAELSEFMDQKLKNYSSGMQVRLAFSVAIKAQGDILVLDEVLAVGDEAFQKKCYRYFAKLKKEKKTVILVTHSMDSVQQFCNNAILVEDGEIAFSGNSAKVAQRYRELFMPTELMQKQYKKGNDGLVETDFVKAKVDLKQTREKILVDIEVQEKIKLDEDAIIGFCLDRDNGERVYRWSSDETIEGNLSFNPARVSVEIDNIFPEGVFSMFFVVKSRDRAKDYAVVNDVLQFEIMPRSDCRWGSFWKPAEKTMTSSVVKKMK